MTSKAPTDIDQHIAARLKARRQESDCTQIGLAAALGVTFQQLQKYESGANRITAGRLYQIAKALKVPITYFFKGLPDEPRGRSGATDLREHADHEVKVQANVDAGRRNAPGEARRVGGEKVRRADPAHRCLLIVRGLRLGR